MPNFSARPIGAGAGGYYNDTTVLLPLGAPVESRDGRMFRWAKVSSAADSVAGNVMQAPAEIANHQARTVSTVAIGATSIVFTPGNTGGAAGLYSEGYLFISVSTGLGYRYKVSQHDAITASTAFTLNLDPADPIQIATVTATTKGDLIHNNFQNVIQSPITTITANPAGVSPYIITASSNGWLQTGGACAVLTKGTPGPGLPVSVPGSVAGGVVINTAALHIVGYMMETGVDAATCGVYLTMW